MQAAVQLRTIPGLFVGSRTLFRAAETPRNPTQTPFVCGACEDEVIRAEGRAALKDVVVRCACGAYNQL